MKILFLIRLLICSIWFSETVSFLENLTNCSKKSVQHEILLHFNFAGFSSNFWILRHFIFESQLKYYIFQHFNVVFTPNYFNSQHFDLLLKIVFFVCVSFQHAGIFGKTIKYIFVFLALEIFLTFSSGFWVFETHFFVNTFLIKKRVRSCVQ